MGLTLIAVAVALVLLLLIATSVVLVKLVLYVSLQNTLLVLLGTSLYWFINSRRQRYAKGFYSCCQVPQEQQQQQQQQMEQVASLVRDQAQHQDANEDAASTVCRSTEEPCTEPVTTTAKATHGAAVASIEADVATVADDERDVMQQLLPEPLIPTKILLDASSFSATESEDDDDELVENRIPTRPSLTSSPRQTAPPPPTPALSRKVRPRSSSSSSGISSANRKRLMSGSPRRPSPPTSAGSSNAASPNSLTPVRSRRAATLVPPHSGPLKRNAFARRSAASERELMQEKMESDGYWIGDFRLDRQLVLRRSFLGVSGNGSSSDNNSPRAV